MDIALCEQLHAALRSGREAWPGVLVPEDTFGRYLGVRSRGQHADSCDPLEALSNLHVVDLYLACGCVSGIRSAIETFDATFLVKIGTVLKVGHDPGIVDEVRQVLRERMLVGDGTGLGRLASYSGRGKLAHWVSIAAQRIALEFVRNRASEPTPVSTGEFEQAVGVFPEQEMECIRARYQPERREAFRLAVTALSERDRLLLRLNLVDGISLSEIAVAYRVSQSTVSRWLAAARDQIRSAIERTLADQLGVTPGELASLAAAMLSVFDVTLSELLV